MTTDNTVWHDYTTNGTTNQMATRVRMAQSKLHSLSLHLQCICNSRCSLMFCIQIMTPVCACAHHIHAEQGTEVCAASLRCTLLQLLHILSTLKHQHIHVLIVYKYLQCACAYSFMNLVINLSECHGREAGLRLPTAGVNKSVHLPHSTMA